MARRSPETPPGDAAGRRRGQASPVRAAPLPGSFARRSVEGSWRANGGRLTPASNVRGAVGEAERHGHRGERVVGLITRSASNPIGGWYGLKKGLRGRFGEYVPRLLEALGRAEVTHDAKNNRMRAIG